MMSTSASEIQECSGFQWTVVDPPSPPFSSSPPIPGLRGIGSPDDFILEFWELLQTLFTFAIKMSNRASHLSLFNQHYYHPDPQTLPR